MDAKVKHISFILFRTLMLGNDNNDLVSNYSWFLCVKLALLCFELALLFSNLHDYLVSNLHYFVLKLQYFVLNLHYFVSNLHDYLVSNLQAHLGQKASDSASVTFRWGRTTCLQLQSSGVTLFEIKYLTIYFVIVFKHFHASSSTVVHNLTKPNLKHFHISIPVILSGLV